MKKTSCFTLVEILAVIAITGILTVGTIVGVNRMWQNNRIDICESELRDFTTAFKSYYTDYKKPEILPDVNYESVITEWVKLLNDKYLSYDVEIAEIGEDKKSVKLSSVIKKDPWNNKYEFYIYTYSGADSTTKAGLVVITSNGPDAQSNKEGYTDGNFGDDIIAIVDPS